MDKEYYIGLDVGTDSVGWATSDEEFNFLRLKGKTAWGARIFDSAKTAKERRTYRTTGRRLARRKQRIKFLNELFEGLINPIDETFFMRLEQSALWNEDKDANIQNKGFLFLDKKKEKEFYLNYPTIWHLRKAMIEGREEAFKDIRYVYLAIHHIIKYRGNFLSTEEEINTSKLDEGYADQINQFLRSLISEEDEMDSDYTAIKDVDLEEILKIAKKRENATQKKKEISPLVKKYGSSENDIDKYVDMFVSLVAGASYELSKFQGIEEKKSIKFDNKFDDSADEYAGLLGEGYIIVEIAKHIHDLASIHEILNGFENLSSAFSGIYDSHKMQLRALKSICIDIDKTHGLLGTSDSTYFKLFKKKDSVSNYAAYVHVDSEKDRATIEDFLKEVKTTMAPYEEELRSNANWVKLQSFITNGDLMVTIAQKSTSVIPHQLHKRELSIILSNASKYYPEIGDIKEKIMKLFLFRIPYYCGPLNTSSRYSKTVKTRDEKVNPWNFDEIVDLDKTKEKFMNDLTNKCEYLPNEYVLPRESIIYGKYIALDKLNTMRINGVSIDQNIKAELFEKLISTKPKTTVNQIKKYLRDTNDVYRKDGVTIAGIKENDSFDMGSLCLFKEFFGVDSLSYAQIEEAEEIIKIMTIYCDSRFDGEQAVQKRFKEIKTNQMKILRKKKFKDWARFSKKLLNGLYVEDDAGVVHTIMSVMENEVKNFQQALNDEKYGFKKIIDDANREERGDRTKEDIVDEMIENMPPAFRRPTIQAVRIVDEIVKITKKTPKAISIEVTRENQEKKENGKGKEVDSRKKQLTDFLSSLKKDQDQFIREQSKKCLGELNGLEDLGLLKGKHLFLYFKQNGIDVYTGKPIDINDVINSRKYDIDHIIPQRLIKDDSLDNKVLVDREYNQRIKGGRYPIPPEIRNKKEVRMVWDFLHKQGQISDEKHSKLIRSTELTDEELNDFVNSQINVINHSNTVIRDIFKIKYPDTNLIFSKATYASYIRQRLVIPKIRDLNDSHHAVDAYINIVSGVTLYNKFSKRFWIGKKHDDDHDDSMNMINAIDRSLSYNCLAEKVIKNCERHDALLTYRLSYSEAEFYKQTIYKPYIKKGDGGLIPIHTKKHFVDTDKYGGYKDLKTEYHIIAVEKGKKKLVGVPLLYRQLYKDEELADKLIEKYSLKCSPSDLVLNKPIYNNQKVFISGNYYLLQSCNENQIALKPISSIFLERHKRLYVSKFEKYLTLSSSKFIDENMDATIDTSSEKTIKFTKKENYEILKEILSYSFDRKYDYCPNIARLREEHDKLSEDEFMSLGWREQCEKIMGAIVAYGRTASKSTSCYIGSSFRKSKGALLNDDNNKVYPIYESITGLLKSKSKEEL